MPPHRTSVLSALARSLRLYSTRTTTSSSQSTSAFRRLLSSSTAPSPSPLPSPTAAQEHPQLQPHPQQVQAAPLTDSFNRVHTYLRISLTEKCNLRCVYCMPDTRYDTPLPPTNCSTAEFLTLARLFVTRLGITKVRLTGGEPLLHPDVVPITRAIASLPPAPKLAITTNAVTLSRSLPQLASAGLSSLNVSLDTLDAARFEVLARRPRAAHARVLSAIHTLLDHTPTLSLKINVVVMAGVNDDELVDFCRLSEQYSNLKVRFIEYMPFNGNQWSTSKFISYDAMLQLISRHYADSLRPVRAADVDKNDTTKYFQIDGYKGQIGFITSMTNHFCAGCNRLRITADGNLKVCLFDNSEISLRDLMRSGATDDDLEYVIRKALNNKHFSLGGNKDMHEISKSKNRSMVRIGG